MGLDTAELDGRPTHSFLLGNAAANQVFSNALDVKAQLCNITWVDIEQVLTEEWAIGGSGFAVVCPGAT